MNDRYKMILWIPSFYKTIRMAPNYKNFMNSPCTKLKNAHFGIKTQKMEKAWRKWKQDKKTKSLS